MQSTITQAKEWVEANIDRLNNEQLNRLRNEIKTAEAQATAHAEKYINERADQIVASRDDVLEAACELRDAYDALMTDGELGVLTAKEFQQRYTALESQKRLLAGREAEVSNEVDPVANIEEDPVGWVDRTFYSQAPMRDRVAPEFSIPERSQ